MTKFSFEVPTKHLQDFHDLQDYYFVLSILSKDDAFMEFMKTKVMIPGHHSIWVDNSFNETQSACHHHDVLQMYNELTAQKIIPPDCIGWDSEQLIEQAREVKRHDIPYWKMILVAHTFQNLMDIHKHLVSVINVGIPYTARPNWAAEELLWAHKHYNVHYLGLNTIEEIIQYKPLSCDTGMPIKIAMEGKTIEDWIKEDCPHICNKDLGNCGEAYIQAKLTNDQIILARRNIKCLKEQASKSII